MCTSAGCARRSSPIYWSGWCKRCVAPATASPLGKHEEGGRDKLMAAMWTFALARLAGILVLGLCLGLLIGPVWVWILAASCLYLGWQLVTLYRLDRWLRLRSQIDPPNLGGIWGDI